MTLPDPLPDAVADLSPKAKLAHLYVAERDELTIKALMTAAHLPESTAHDALEELRTAGIVGRRVDPTNPLAYVYSLTERRSETNV